MKIFHKKLLITFAVIFLGASFPKSNIKAKDSAGEIRAHYYDLPSITNEPLFSNQFHFNHLNRGNVHTEFQGDGVTVAIIDSGINTNHIDFWDELNTNILSSSASIIYNQQSYVITTKTVRDYGLSVIEDTHGHGTNVAGTIGALINGVGGAGVSPQVNLMVLRVNLFLNEIKEAILYAANNGADIINMSLGIYAENFRDGHGDYHQGVASNATYLQSAINYATNKGVTIVAAAGNDKTDKPSYPAANINVIAVGALGRNSSTNIASYSNYGTENVDIVAPGSVYVANIGGADAYIETQGTSFASPIVASAVALYKSAFPSATPSTIEDKLIATAYDLGTPGEDATFGHGRLDIQELFNEVPVEGVTIAPKVATIRVGETLALTATITPSNATDQRVVYMVDDESVASVDDVTGLVTAISVGTTAIVVGTESGNFYDEMTLHVTSFSDPIAVTSIVHNDDNIKLSLGDNHLLNLTLLPSNAITSDLNFSSEDEAVATITNQGLITAVKSGSTLIRVEAKVGSVSLLIPVQISNVVTTEHSYSFTSKSWNATPKNWSSLKDGNGFMNGGVQVTATTSGANARSPIIFNDISSVIIGYSTNASSGIGTIKLYLMPTTGGSDLLLGSFTTTTSGGVTRRPTNNLIPSGTYSGMLKIVVDVSVNSVYICDITITTNSVGPDDVNVTGITTNLANKALFVDETHQMDYTISPSNATNKNVTFSSDSPSITTVSSSGLITAISPGNAVIKVRTADGNFFAQITISVSAAPIWNETLMLNTANFKMNYTFGENLDLDNLTATYQNTLGVLSTIQGTDLTLLSGNTKTLGTVMLTFAYGSVIDTTHITVTNIGAVQGAPANPTSLYLDGATFAEQLTTTEQTYTNLTESDFTFSGTKLRTVANSSTLFIGLDGHFKNETAFGEITSITLHYNTGGSSSANQDIRFGTSAITSTSGNADSSFTNSTGGTSRIITAPSGTTHFRVDVSNKNLQASITINYTSGMSERFTSEEQGNAYITYFDYITSIECASFNFQEASWITLQNEFNALSEESKTFVWGNLSSDLSARYNIVINGYHYADFLNPPSAQNSFNQGHLNSNIVPLFIFFLISISLSGFFYIRREIKN